MLDILAFKAYHMPKRSKYEEEPTGGGGTMFIVFKSYLNRLEAIEKSKPEPQRRRVPSMEELAQRIGVHPVTLSNIANSNIKQLNLETGGRIIHTMRSYGFQMELSDLLEYREGEPIEA